MSTFLQETKRVQVKDMVCLLDVPNKSTRRMLPSPCLSDQLLCRVPFPFPFPHLIDSSFHVWRFVNFIICSSSANRAC